MTRLEVATKDRIRGSIRRAGMVAFPAVLLALAGCGGGGSQESAPSVLPVSRALGVAALDGMAPGEARAEQALAEVRASAALLAETADYLSASTATKGRAVYTKTIGSVTATLTVTEVSRTKSTFQIVLNGTVGPTTYTDFRWCEGTSETGTANGKVGTHQLSTWYALGGSTATTRATGESWFFGDGSVAGTLALADGKATAYERTTGGAWTFRVYAGAPATTPKLAEATVNADLSGSATLLCTEDAQARATLTWTAAKTGQVCLFATACGGDDRPCRAFP